MVRFFFVFFALLFSCNQKQSVYDLSKFERSIYSQNGEDGVIEILFELLGTDSRYCVEFGAVDGLYVSNTLNLRKHKGWTCLLLDGGHENQAINLQREFVTAENINELFEKYEVPENLDLLSIDIDYNDFYVWKALNSRYRPRVVVVEYNAMILPHDDSLVPYKADAVWDWTNYFGAGILAFSRLAKMKGYTLVHADRSGTNLFFVRDELMKGIRFKNAGQVEELYRPPHYLNGSGPLGSHQKDPLDRKFISFQEALNLSD